MIYALKSPKVVFGAGALAKVAEWVKPEANVLLVTGQSAVRSGVTAHVANLLAPRKVTVFDKITAEPDIALIDAVRALRREVGADTIIGIGGGSAMDVAKVAAAAGTSEIPSAEYFYARSALPAQGFPCAAIPTTAGTGAEVTPNGVFSDSSTGIKQSIRGGSTLPEIAIVDPELTVSCPARVTAASGMDALTQGIEAYLSRKANHATDALAAMAVKLIWNSLEKAYADGGNLAARSDMSEGTLLGAMAFAASGLGAVHGLAHPVGAKYHLPHGLVCGILLPEVLRANRAVCGAKMDELAHLIGSADADALIAGVVAKLTALNLPHTLPIVEKDVPWIVAHSRSGSMKCNPRDFSDAELAQILRNVTE